MVTSVEEMFVKLKKQQNNQGKQIPFCIKKGDSSTARVSHCFSKCNFLMIKLLPQHCEHTKIHEAKQRQLTAGKGQVVTGRNVRRYWRSKEGKLSVGQREDTKIVVSGERKTFHWRMPQAKDTRASKEDYQIIQGTAQLQDRGIPQLLPLEIKLHYCEIRFQSVQSLEPQIKRNPT